MFRLNGEQREGRAENKEREKNQAKWKKGKKTKKKTLHKGGEKYFLIGWREAKECTVIFHLWKATVALWVFFFFVFEK